MNLPFADAASPTPANRLPHATELVGELGMRMGRAVNMLTRCVDLAIVGEGYSRAYFPRSRAGAGYDEWPVASELGEDIAARFDQLAERWIADTAAQSSFTRIFSHDAYLEILTLGRTAIPQLLERLGDEPERWVGALRLVTKEPIGEHAASAGEAVTLWRQWGHEHGYGQ